ncbi:MAG: hypothetical protein A2Y91_06590 [Chloroflexi bacterium RBG_13_54_8]|nr:MAG: hypothetical protein A2Y91_06590 [Chloroflexi bacterium RBG_13_54_8]
MRRGEQVVSAEERLLEAIAEDDEEGTEAAPRPARSVGRRHRQVVEKETDVQDFLGDGRRSHATAIVPRYYGELLTWALHRHIEAEGWKVVRTLNYHWPEPAYIDVSTDHDKGENLLMDGQLLLEKGDMRFVATLDATGRRWRNCLRVEGLAGNGQDIEQFISGVSSIAHNQNFYRGKKLEFAGRIRFLNLASRSWDSVVLASEVKAEIRANTVEFLNKRDLWSRYGMPLKRGLLLAGEPGTGKTAICKAVLAEACGTTCIATNAYALSADKYITELYDLAQDLSPSIVLIEDIDSIGQNREEFGYRMGPALTSLLAVLDGIEEKGQIVTIATTNSLDRLDKALAERPSRFDHVVELPRPTLEQRQAQIRQLCQKVPLNSAAADYVARRSEGCTPAQVQEILFSLAIEHASQECDLWDASVSHGDIDRTIRRIRRNNGRRIGFGNGGSCDGNGSDRLSPLILMPPIEVGNEKGACVAQNLEE